uniref:Uncharacterized protein n=1 Tax=Rangifer tarandus platyrhynchus TaxID=3082113 RepID=A0ACB0F4M0_RANTA|nr:unnamed protein product [Rangifer tarandus platyrhynchus]
MEKMKQKRAGAATGTAPSARASACSRRGLHPTRPLPRGAPDAPSQEKRKDPRRTPFRDGTWELPRKGQLPTHHRSSPAPATLSSLERAILQHG